MSWEHMFDRTIKPCKCGKGNLKEKVFMDDWNRERTDLYIDCDECNQIYRVIEEIHTPKPYHEFSVYKWIEK